MHSANSSKVLVALSGGVDSAVSAYLLKKQGYDVTAVFMQNWEEEFDVEICTVKEDYDEAQKVADFLSIKLEYVNFSYEYWQNVFSLFIDKLQMGLTPNPDILCNKYIKFNALQDYASDNNYHYLATGHYAKLIKKNEDVFLNLPKDHSKDQTYFLYAVPKEKLKNVIFPLQDLTKLEVRKIAKNIGLPNYNRKDSMGICFIGRKKFDDFLKDYINLKEGIIYDKQGNKLGKHKGYAFYTLGQRKGLNIGGIQGSDHQPWYVAQKSAQDNSLIVVHEGDEMLYQKEVEVSDINWLTEKPQAFSKKKIHCKYRYRQEFLSCQFELMHQDNQRLKVEFAIKQSSVTPGQSIVFYQNKVCLGGGIIQNNNRIN